MEIACMMIRKRRLTLSRTASFGAVVVLVVLIIVLCRDNPLDIIVISPSNVFGKYLQRNGLFAAKSKAHDFKHEKAKSFTPCELYRLQPEKKETHHGDQQAQCKRVQPFPGSCDVAEKLFHSRPTATCDLQSQVEFCKLRETPKGPVVKCSKEQCKLSLSAATMDTRAGELQWSKFKSMQGLEDWINSLLLPSQSKKHFGFCFIACEEESVEFDGEEGEEFGDDDAFFGSTATLQLLLLPPSIPAAQPNSRLHSDFDVNLNLIFIDSVSRQHFFRSLPDTVKLFRDLSAADSTSRVSVFDFELVQSVRSRTFETLQALFSGEIDPSVKPFGVLDLPPEPLKTEGLLKALKRRGYSTLWLEDLCYLWEWGLSKDLLVHNKTFSHKQTWKTLMKALNVAGIDSLDVTYAMCKVLSENGVPDHFHGPEAVCLNGKHQHKYLLEYLLMYQESMVNTGTPFFTFMETNVGHEDTGRRIQTFDRSLRWYLENSLKQQNTLTILFSDHGNSYGDFLGETMEGRMELFHPHLFVLVPDKVAQFLGESKMKALRVNQRRLISHLDLHYMLQSVAHNSKNKVSRKRKGYNVSSLGLLEPVSSDRTCNHIPRIMPNLCICENFDMPADNDDYHALFAHLAVGKINNEIQRQYQQSVLASSEKPSQAFGHCKRLHLGSFENVRKSFFGNTISLKMDLLVPQEGSAIYDDSPDLDFLDISSSSNDTEIFFVAMHAQLGSSNSSRGSIILETLDRITPYSKFSVCADSTVKLQLCICDVNETNNSRTDGRFHTPEELGNYDLFLTPEVYIAEHSQKCLALIVKKNKHGGVFSVANTCKGKVFDAFFELETTQMIVSDAMPRHEIVFPGQELFLCMAVTEAPRAEWSWSFTLRHQMRSL